jgi:membrane fusion protein, multidrug efflux system
MNLHLHRVLFGAALGATVALSSACEKGEGKGVAKGEPNAANAGRGGEGRGGGAEKGGPGGAGGRRGAMSITLGTNDVRNVERASIEVGVAFSGDLRPIEEVSVRARLEGDLDGVFVRAGDRVTRGQLLARFEAHEEESNKRSAEADRVAARSDLATAEWNLEQAEELFKAGAIPERDVRAARQTVESAKARLVAAESRVNSTNSFVNDTRVLAPTSGVIEERLVENGEHVSRGAEMFKLVRSDVLELSAAVPARQANEIRAGQRVHFASGGRTFEGRVARVSPTINPSTRSITVYLQAPNTDGSLKGNSFTTGRIVSRNLPDVLVVPALAVRQTAEDGKPFVYRVVNGTIDIALIQLGATDDAAGLAEVTDGLQLGDQVIVGNVGTLGRGMKVQIISGSRDRPESANGDGTAPGGAQREGQRGRGAPRPPGD